LQAPIFDGLSFDPLALFEDGWNYADVGIGGCHVVQALLVTLVVVVLDERRDPDLKVTGQEVAFQQDAVLEGLVPSLDLTLGLAMERRVGHVAHAVSHDIFGQFADDVAGPLSDSNLGLCRTWAWSQPEAASAKSSVSVTS
jgi:hypothetical protein